MSKEDENKGEVRLDPNKGFDIKDQSKTWRRSSSLIKDTLDKIRNLVNEQENLQKYPINFDILPQEGYSFNCALWTKKTLREMNIKLLDSDSITSIKWNLCKNNKDNLWLYFKYFLPSLSLSWHIPESYVKMNSSSKLIVLNKRFKNYKKYIE